VFLTGLVLFTAASAGCALAPAIGVLVLIRLIQGAAAALLVPSSLALLQASYPDRAGRARAVGLWGGIGGLAGHPGLASQGPAVTERDDLPGPARVGQHGGDRSNVGISGNLSHTINSRRPTLRLQTKRWAQDWPVQTQPPKAANLWVEASAWQRRVPQTESFTDGYRCHLSMRRDLG
jgi:hypothetical protein